MPKRGIASNNRRRPPVKATDTIASRQADIDRILDEYGVPHSPVVKGDSLEKKVREQNRGEKVDKPI